jgi:hypothetical protein
MPPIQNPKSKIQNKTRLAWHHVIFDIPSTWEVIGHKKNADDGQLSVSDRYGEAMQVFWKRLKQAPAIEDRLVELAAANDPESEAKPAIRKRLTECSGWRFLPSPEPSAPAFAARFLDQTRVLLTVVFPPYPGLDTRPLARAVLESFRPNDGPDRDWAAFGLDVTLPAQFRLTEVRALPAMQVLSFENDRRDSISIHRYGMTSILLAGDDMATFFARVKGPRIQLRRRGVFGRPERYEGIELSYQSRGKEGLSRLLGRKREGRVWLWHCEDRQRLYAIDHCARAANLRNDLVERVRCV